MRTIRTTLPLTLVLLASCAATTARVDDALLSELPRERLTAVIEARAEKDSAQMDYARAQRDTRWAEEQAELARSALNVSRAELDEAKLALTVADRSGTVGQLASAQAEFDFRAARADSLREHLALRKRERDVAKLAERLSLESLRLADARVELDKAEAVQELDRLDAQRVPLKDHQQQVRYHESEVELAQVRLKAAEKELEIARGEYEATRAQAEALRPYQGS